MKTKNTTSSIKVAVATHKKYFMPNDSLYMPVLAGSSNKNILDSNYAKDNTGDNISKKNSLYSEMTVAYWAAKNLNYDYIGLVHYRRYFKGSGEKNILTKKEALNLINKASVVLPKKRHYIIETVKSHYSHTFDVKQIDILRTVIVERQKAYLPDFDKQMKKRSLHICNMFIMPKKMLNDYLDWLFDIMDVVESKIDFTNMNSFEKRALGRLTERLLDVYVNHNNIEYVEVPVINIEPINWFKKIFYFLKAKIFKISYKEGV